MSSSYVLMTAMPPTKGHLHLIEFARHVADEVHVIVCTQPDEPFAIERVSAIRDATSRMSGIHVHNIHQVLPQEPEDDPGFWDMWKGFLVKYGITKGDFVVASEAYGKTLSVITRTTWIPYDIDRGVFFSKATWVRDDPRRNFKDILPEFQPHLRARITLFGSESVGKTTLSKDLSMTVGGYWLPEWARPYMERFEPAATVPVMTNIWRGQKALQLLGQDLADKPFIIQDTDLFSTWGYWKLWESKLGPVPDELFADAIRDKSDLYIIPRANIPFEEDPLRFGGDVRETLDQYWVDICEKYDLPYIILNGSSRATRTLECVELTEYFYKKTIAPRIAYQRRGAEYIDNETEMD